MEAVHLPIQHVNNVVEASASDTPVVIYCVSCNRSRKADPSLIARKLGPLPFGLILGVFPCKRCQERTAVVLPWYAPTPREWAKVARDHFPKEEEPRIYVDGQQFQFRIDQWNTKHSAILKTLALLTSSKVSHVAFDHFMLDYPRDDLTLRNKTLLMRDSRRPEVREA